MTRQMLLLDIIPQKYRSEYRPWCEPTALFSCSNYTDVSFTCPKERHPSLVGLPEPSDHRLQSTGCELDLWRQGVIPISIYHIVIFADYSPVDETPEPSSQRFIDPLTTLLATRVSRGRDAIIDLKAAICQYSGKGCHGMEPYQEQVLEFEISAQSLGLPLSWSLGKVGYTKVVTAVASNFNRGLPHSKCEYARQDEHGCWFVDTEKQLALEYALTGYRPN